MLKIEILRDYGFIEEFPQEWWFDDYQWKIDQDPESEDATKLNFKWHSKRMRPNDRTYEQFVTQMNRQMKRLRKIRNLATYNADEVTKDIPEHELKLIWEFLEANILGYSMAVEAALKEFEPSSSDESDTADDVEGTCSNPAMEVNASHYDELEVEYDDLDWSPLGTCDSDEIMKFRGYEVVEDLETTYQDVVFKINEKTDDVCMDIERVLQICSCYR